MDTRNEARGRAAQTAQSVLTALRQRIGAECPECGSDRTEDNGATEYRCCACDHRWGIEHGEQYGF